MEGDSYKVFEYTFQGGQMREIKTPVQYFGMAVINNQLIITGGWDKIKNLTNEVWLLDSASGTWTQPFPAMPTARDSLSAVGYKRWVLVAGGYLSLVEILDTTNKKWYRATPLPHETFRPSLTVIQDTLYVLWGNFAVSVSIPMLISDAMSQIPASDISNGRKPTKWQPLPDTPIRNPTTTTIDGLLVAMGGDPPTPTIAMYLPQIKQWLKVAELPYTLNPRYRCTCAFLPEIKKMMVIGGKYGDYFGNYITTGDQCTL